MMNIANEPHRLFLPSNAEAVVGLMNSDVDDDWVYSVKHDPAGTGLSFIEVHDADGIFVARLV